MVSLLVVRFFEEVELFNDDLPRLATDTDLALLAPSDFARPGDREAAFFALPPTSFPAVFRFSGDLERTRLDERFILAALTDALLIDADLAALVLVDFVEIARARFIGDLELSRLPRETGRFTDVDLTRTAAFGVLAAAIRFGLVDVLRGGAMLLYAHVKQRRR